MCFEWESLPIYNFPLFRFFSFVDFFLCIRRHACILTLIIMHQSLDSPRSFREQTRILLKLIREISAFLSPYSKSPVRDRARPENRDKEIEGFSMFTPSLPPQHSPTRQNEHR